MPEMITVMLCVNDPANGMDTGRVSNINISMSADGIELEGCEPGPRWSIVTKMRGPIRTAKVRISRRTFNISSHQNWVGNWCWDAVMMPIDEVVRLLNYLRDSGEWQCTRAETRFFERFKSGKAIDEKFVRRTIKE
jgi:hypothetical protein